MIDLFPTRTIAVDLFGFAVHWYGLLYFLGFLTSYLLLPRLQSYRDLHLSKEDWSQILSWSVLGVILGGRLGYVLLYEPFYYAANPLEILAVWNGGMASHGGFLGVFVALWIVTKRKGIDRLALADVVVVPIALGLAFGRFGNFINHELYGSVTALPWGIAIPGVEGLRHPTQIYAMLKDLLIAFLCFLHLRKTPIRRGETCALFFILYAVLRFMIEFVRIPSHEPFTLGFLTLTRGQLYTFPLLLVGLWLLWRSRRSA